MLKGQLPNTEGTVNEVAPLEPERTQESHTLV